MARGVLDKIEQLSGGAFALRHPDGRLRLPVDLMNFTEQVVGVLAKAWFGLPDGVHMAAGGRLPGRRRRLPASHAVRGTSSAPRA